MTTPTPPRESEGRRIARLFSHTGIYAAGSFGLKILSAVIVPIYTVLLAPEEYGVWALAAMLLAGLAYLYNPALHGAVTRFFYDHEHDDEARLRFQGTVVTFLLGWSTVVSITLVLAGPWLFERLFDDFPFDPYGWFLVAIAQVTVLGVVPNAVWIASEKPRTFVSFSVASNAVNMLGALALVALAGLGVMGLFWARLLGVAIVALPYVIWLRRNVGLAFDAHDLSWALRFSLPLVPHLLAHWVLGMADRYLIERELGLAAVGIYGSAYVFINGVNTVSASLNQAMVPLFNRAYGDESERAFVGRTITYFVMSVSAVSLAAVVVSPTLVRLLYAERYGEAAEIAAILSAGGLFQGLYYVYVNGLFFFKRNLVIPFITVASGTVNVVLNLLWIPKYGIAGAAWATLVGYLVLTLGVRWGCRRVTHLPFETGRLWRVAAVAFPVALGSWMLDGRLPLVAEVPVKLALLAATPLILHALGFWRPEEVAWLETRVRKGLRRLRLR